MVTDLGGGGGGGGPGGGSGGGGGGTNSKSGRRSTKPQDDKDAQKTWETNETGMKLIGQQIKKLLIK